MKSLSINKKVIMFFLVRKGKNRVLIRLDMISAIHTYIHIYIYIYIYIFITEDKHLKSVYILLTTSTTPLPCHNSFNHIEPGIFGIYFLFCRPFLPKNHQMIVFLFYRKITNETKIYMGVSSWCNG